MRLVGNGTRKNRGRQICTDKIRCDPSFRRTIEPAVLQYLYAMDGQHPPLAERMRPKSLDAYVGQRHLVGEDAVLRRAVLSGNIHSMIFWGPPGSGKTTLARIIAEQTKSFFVPLSGVLSNKDDLMTAVKKASERRKFKQQRTILFVDEIHRWNKAQQDALLQSVENGTVVLIGATTENPSFEVISPLLSRCQVYVLEPLTEADLELILNKALTQDELVRNVELTDEAKEELIRLSGSDARVMLNALEVAVALSGENKPVKIGRDKVREAYQVRHYKYDRSGEEHYNTISAFIKSVRGSDPDAAVYYLARMLEAGEDPKFIARRLIILAT